MSENQFFENKGPFPLKEIIKTIGCSGDFSQKDNLEIIRIIYNGEFEITNLN